MYFKTSNKFCIYETYIHTMDVNIKDELANSLHSDVVECFGTMNITSNYQKKSFEEKVHADHSSDLCSDKIDTEGVDNVQIDSCESHPTPDSFMCLKESEQFLNNFEFVSNKPGSFIKKTVQELNSYTLKQLQALVEDLTQSVEQVSSELVQLLLENDALQQESDARNIAIEQLLKMTVKINESDLKPIQMSVVLPDDDDCDVI